MSLLKKLFGIKTIDFNQLLEDGAYIVDVRTPGEFNSGNIKESTNIPLDQIRPVTDQPFFYIALVTIIVGVQLFLVGFISELIILINSDKNGYIIEDSDIK